MNFEQQLKIKIEQEVMEAINGFGIKAAVREKIVEVGEMSREKTQELINSCIDSYVRSFDIENFVKCQIDLLVSEKVRECVKKSLDKYIQSPYSWSPHAQKLLDNLIEKELRKQFEENYTLKVINTKEQKN